MQELPLQHRHEAACAKFGEFAGYRMPLYYSKPIEEHHTVRKAVGVFDITHMGQFVAEGEQAEAFLQYALPNDVTTMQDGYALYSPLCREDGGVLDDLIIYRHSPRHYRIIVNAGNRERDFQWLEGLAGRFEVGLRDVSSGHCLFAVQGPEAFARLRGELEHSPGDLGYYRFTETRGFGVPLFTARTGYTGEPGCEIAMAREHAEQVWDQLTGSLGITPIGLAARDTLRLEACMALYGHELREEWNPLECGLGWTVKLKGEQDFLGKQALLTVKDRGVAYKLVGLEVTGRGIPRGDYPVLDESGAEAGVVTSGAMTPTTGRPLAMARVKAALAALDTRLLVEIRGKQLQARVVSRPFYKNPALRA
ncbi:MAG: glycine cleavage system aminomethyltransferase GcvT [SAR324 cluster bacterium]|nr:glycine cleavage system aminomethyltransferase GcvT [SAR324 cluster bacterium]MCZ6842085.1 glycine cleavage system aminomethyltransferase GcvT [SAR324 cluster bacterium]